MREDYYIPDDDLDFPLGIDRRNRQHGFFTTTAEELLGEPYRKLAVVSGFELHHFIVPKETKRLLKLGNRLPSLGWLYGNQSAKVIDEIKVSTVCLNINLLLILHQACDEIVIVCFM